MPPALAGAGEEVEGMGWIGMAPDRAGREVAAWRPMAAAAAVAASWGLRGGGCVGEQWRIGWGGAKRLGGGLG